MVHPFPRRGSGLVRPLGAGSVRVTCNQRDYGACEQEARASTAIETTHRPQPTGGGAVAESETCGGVSGHFGQKQKGLGWELATAEYLYTFYTPPSLGAAAQRSSRTLFEFQAHQAIQQGV